MSPGCWVRWSAYGPNSTPACRFRHPKQARNIGPEGRLTAQLLQDFPRFRQPLELFFGLFEFAGVNAAPRAAMLHRKLQVQHLVEQHVLHRASWNGGAVQRLA